MTSIVALLAVPAALALGTVAFAAARMRALGAARRAAIEAHHPLSPSERLRVARWRRRVGAAVVATCAAYAAAVGWALVAPRTAARGPLGPAEALAVLGAVSALAALVQFSERCPRCGFNLGFQARLTLDSRCSRCTGDWQ